MSTRSGTWSRPAEPPPAWLPAVAAVIVLLGSWVTLHYGFYGENDIVDTPVYEDYGNRISQGEVPYRDFELEYPPGSLPVFAAPAVFDGEIRLARDFRARFELLMFVCAAAMAALMAVVLRAVGATTARLAGALAFAALAPLALGSVVLTRFDLWPAALTVGAVAALVTGRDRLGFGVLALGVAAKLYPGALVPLALVYAWKRHGRREALVCLGLFAVVLAACVVPFVALSPGGVWAGVVRQTTRPLQIESLGSGLLLALHHLAGLDLTMEASYGSQNLSGPAPDLIAAAQSALQVAGLLVVWALFARGAATPERLVHASAAAVCVFVAFGKVLSPQFLIWLIPLVPLVRGRRGATASALLAAALVLTQLWFPLRYWELVLEFDALASTLVLARDSLLVTLAGVLALALRANGRGDLADGERARGGQALRAGPRSDPLQDDHTGTRIGSHRVARP